MTMPTSQWAWAQPKSQDELLLRLSDARDLNVPERERENLCACAIAEIKRLQQETLDLHAAGCTESERADAAEADRAPLLKRIDLLTEALIKERLAKGNS
jgi:hypothetical protein